MFFGKSIDTDLINMVDSEAAYYFDKYGIEAAYYFDKYGSDVMGILR
jgi:hypothetical protein